MFCSKCSKEIPERWFSEPGNYNCPQCKSLIIYNGSTFKVIEKETSQNDEKTGGYKRDNTNIKMLFGIIGSLILFIGVFMPIVSVPILGSRNYFMNGKGDGTIVLVLAVITFFSVISNKFRNLYFTGLISLGILLFTFFNMKISHAKSGNPFHEELQWGWAVLIVGTVLILASAAMKKEEKIM